MVLSDFGLTAAEYMMTRSGSGTVLPKPTTLPTLTVADPEPVLTLKQAAAQVDLSRGSAGVSESITLLPSTAPPAEQAYTEAMKAQADEVLDLGDSLFDKIPPWAIWGAIAGGIGYAIWRRRGGGGSLQGYRRRKRRSR